MRLTYSRLSLRRKKLSHRYSQTKRLLLKPSLTSSSITKLLEMKCIVTSKKVSSRGKTRKLLNWLKESS